jgi:hypothetical protein
MKPLPPAAADLLRVVLMLYLALVLGALDMLAHASRIRR